MSLGITAQGENLVFLLSLPRSGSTLLSLILGNHSQVLCPPEPWLLLKLLSLRERGDIDSRYDDELASIAFREFLSEASFEEAVRAFAVSAYSSRLEAAGRSVFIDKTPRYYHILPWIDRLFPRSRKIWLRRNPLDVAASQKISVGISAEMLTGKEFGPASLDLPVGLFSLDSYFADPSPEKLIISYESLVRDPQQLTAGVCRFLGLSAEPALLDYSDNTELLAMHRSASMGDKHCIDQTQPTAGSVGRWKRDLSVNDIRTVVELLGLEVFGRHGYWETAEELNSSGIHAVSEGAAAAKRAGIDSRRLDRSILLTADVEDMSARLDEPPSSRIVRAVRGRLFSALTPGLALRQHPPRPLVISRQNRAEGVPASAPTMSIVTPCLNQGTFLRRTIESVLDQGYLNLQYTVRDGGSNDNSSQILVSFGDRIAWESNRDGSQARALNLGFSRVNGEIMGWLNSDDILLPGALSAVAAHFSRHPEIDVLYGHRVMIDEAGREVGRWVLPSNVHDALPWADFVPQESLFWRRRIWESVGSAIDESFEFALDWDLLLRFRSAGARFARLNRFLAAFRLHDGQKTSRLLAVTGRAEMDRLRRRIHGRYLPKLEVQRAVRAYEEKATLNLALFRLGLYRA